MYISGIIDVRPLQQLSFHHTDEEVAEPEECEGSDEPELLLQPSAFP